MIPCLEKIDHVHVYVSNREAAVKWYADVLGMRPIKAFLSWAKGGGPLTLEDPSGEVHLALFERDNPASISTVAFGTSGKQFIKWKNHLKSKGLSLRVNDHDMAFSLYFSDPDGNLYEITTYEHEAVRQAMLQRD